MLSLRGHARPAAGRRPVGHLAGLLPRLAVRRLYIVRDNDPAGQGRRNRGRGRRPRGSRRWCWRRRWGTSTTTYGSSAPARRRFGPVAARPGGRDTVLAIAGAARTDAVAGAVPVGAGRPACVIRPESRAHGLLRGRSERKRPGPATAGGGYFPRPCGPSSRDKIAAPRRPPLRCGRFAVQARSARSSTPAKAAMGAATPENSTMTDRSSPTASRTTPHPRPPRS